MPSGSDSESPDEISLLADSGVPVLNISAGQVTRMNGIIDELTEQILAGLCFGQENSKNATDDNEPCRETASLLAARFPYF